MDQAVRLDSEGVAARDVHAQTGWFKGVDDLWRFEISDCEAKILPAMGTLREGPHESKEIISVDWRARADGSFDLTLNPRSPQKVADFVRLRGVPWEVVCGVLPAAVCKEIALGRGSESFIGLMEPARNIEQCFQFEGMNMLPLWCVFDHPVLYTAYPDLREIPVQVYPELRNSAALVVLEDGREVIRVGPGQHRVSLLHEIQHAVQAREGFLSGGSVDGLQKTLASVRGASSGLAESLAQIDACRERHAAAAYALLGGAVRERLMLNQDFSTMLAELYAGDEDAFFRDVCFSLDEIGIGEVDAQLQGVVDDIAGANGRMREIFREQERIARVTQALESHGITGAYWRLGGEVEARNTTARMDMTQQELMASWPLDTIDVPSDEIIANWEVTSGGADFERPRGQ